MDYNALVFTLRSIILVWFLGWALTGCSGNSVPTPQSEPLRLVDTIEIQPTIRDHEFVPLIGRTEPWREATLQFEVPGVIAEVYVEEGELVQAQQPIARLDLRDFQLSLARAEAENKVALANLDLLRAGSRVEDIEAAQAEWARAHARALFWTGEYKRADQLRRDHKTVMTTTEFHRIRQEYDAAQHGERMAKAQFSKAKVGPRKEEVQAAQAESEARQQAVSLAQRQLEKATLKAPFTGLVEKRFVDPGSYNSVFPSGGIPVIQLVDMQRVDAVVAVPESEREHYQVGDQVQVTSATRGEVQASGSVISLATIADAASGTYWLRIRISNDQGLFTGGLVVSAQRVAAIVSSEPTIFIPLNSIRRAYAQSPYVLVVEAVDGIDNVVAREVRLGPIRGDLVMVTSGLVGGERLIVRGQHLVVTGDQVRQRPFQAASVAKSK